MKKPSVVIFVSGGLVQDVIGNMNIKVRVLDEDNAETTGQKNKLEKREEALRKTHKEELY